MSDLDLVGEVAPLKQRPPPTAVRRRAKRQKSRAQHVPTSEDRQSVLAWVAGGIPQSAMAALMGIHESTLRKHYRVELNAGVQMANGKVVGSLFGKAIAGDTTSMIWWTKTRMGWRERGQYDADNPLVVHQHGDGGPVDPVTLARALRDELLRLRDQPRIEAA